MHFAVLLLSTLLPLTFASPNPFAPFEAPFLEASFPIDNTSAPLELLKRQNNGCPNGFSSCQNLGGQAAAVCCASSQICTPDAANHVACCQKGAVCTGTIGAQTYNPGTLTAHTTTSTTISGASSIITAPATLTSTAGQTGFIIASSSIVAVPGGAGKLRQPPAIFAVIHQVVVVPAAGLRMLQGR